MGIFNKTNAIELKDEDLQDAKSTAGIFTEDLVKHRAFANVIAARSALKLLFSLNIDATNLYSMYSINKVLEKIDIADIYVGDLRIDSRLISESGEIFIPKSHFNLGIVPDLYVVFKINKEMSAVEFMGCINPEEIDKSNENKDYYFVNEDILYGLKIFKNLIKNNTSHSNFVATDDEIERAGNLIVPLEDGEIFNADYEFLIKQLVYNVELRRKAVEFENFEFISKKVVTDETIYGDSVLGLIGSEKLYNRNEFTTDIDLQELVDESVDSFVDDFNELDYVAPQMDEITGEISLDDALSQMDDNFELNSNSEIVEDVSENENSSEEDLNAFLNEMSDFSSSDDEPEITSEHKLSANDTNSEPSNNYEDFVNLPDDFDEADINNQTDEISDNNLISISNNNDDDDNFISDSEEDENQDLLTFDDENNDNDDNFISDSEEDENQDLLTFDDENNNDDDNSISDSEDENPALYNFDSEDSVDDLIANDEAEELQTFETFENEVTNIGDNSDLDINEYSESEQYKTDYNSDESDGNDNNTNLTIDNDTPINFDDSTDSDDFTLPDLDNFSLDDTEDFEDISNFEDQNNTSDFGTNSNIEETSYENDIENESKVKELNTTKDFTASEIKDETEDYDEHLKQELAPDLQNNQQNIQKEESKQILPFDDDTDMADLPMLSIVHEDEETFKKKVYTTPKIDDIDLSNVNLDDFDDYENEDKEEEARHTKEIDDMMSDLEDILNSENISLEGVNDILTDEELAESLRKLEEEQNKKNAEKEAEIAALEVSENTRNVGIEENKDSKNITEVNSEEHTLTEFTESIDSPNDSETATQDTESAGMSLDDFLNSSSFNDMSTSDENSAIIENNSNNSNGLEDLYANNNVLSEQSETKDNSEILLTDEASMVDNSTNKYNEAAVDDKSAAQKPKSRAPQLAVVLVILMCAAVYVNKDIIMDNFNISFPKKAEEPAPEFDLNSLREPQTAPEVPAEQQEEQNTVSEDSPIPSLPQPTDMPPSVPEPPQEVAAAQNQPAQPVAISQNTSNKISKLSWEVPETLANNDKIRKYLQIAGRTLKLTLQNDILVATELPFSNKVMLDIKILPSGNIASSDFIISSGSKQIDNIVLQSVKDTFKYVRPPLGEIPSPNSNITLIINF